MDGVMSPRSFQRFIADSPRWYVVTDMGAGYSHVTLDSGAFVGSVRASGSGFAPKIRGMTSAHEPFATQESAVLHLVQTELHRSEASAPR